MNNQPMSDEQLEELRRKVTTSGASVGPLWRNEAKELIVELDRLRTEYEKTKRGAHTLGQVIEQQATDALNATGLHHLIDETGDGDWGAVWENLAELGERARRSEAVLARVTDDSMIERIRDELAGTTIGSGYYQTSVATDEAAEMAEWVLAAIRAVAADGQREAPR